VWLSVVREELAYLLRGISGRRPGFVTAALLRVCAWTQTALTKRKKPLHD